MDVDTAIKDRRTIGVFSERPVAPEVVEELIEAARWAPNHKHTEPWRFHVVSGQAREEMCEAILAGGGEFAKDPRGKLMRSPSFIAVTQQAVLDDPIRDREDYAAVCCAVQNMMLAATSRGLASKWSTGALAENSAAKRWLGIGEHDRIVAYLYIGYPPEDMREMPAERRPAEVVWRG
ncbi:MAG: nitroreductase [Chloroflexi bacterium]|nr:nitroreductase [Chloroflexota bacterium]